MYMEKEQKKNETKEKKPLTEQQRQQRRKMLVYPLMGLLFLGCMWLIFAPSSEDREKAKQGQGFNTDMPLPEDSKIIGDKAKAYEQLQLENRQKERRGMVGDLSSFWHDGAEKPDTAAASDDYRLTQTEPSENERADKQQAGIRTSAAAYERLNTSLGTFYEPPKEDAEKEELRQRIDELERMVMEQEKKPSTMEEQVALLEKSYEIAARYMNGGQAPEAPRQKASVSGKASVQPVRQVRRNIVSLLAAPLPDSVFAREFVKPRNWGFNTVGSDLREPERNSIRAAVQQTVTLTDGGEVTFRLLEPMMAGDLLIPSGTPVTGAARINGERLTVKVSAVQHGGAVVPVDLSVYDTNGNEGIPVPGSEELNAVKEIAANMGAGMGSSITITDDAGSQLLSDLGRSAIQGVSQYVSKKMRSVKVTLKAGYSVLLLPPLQ